MSWNGGKHGICCMFVTGLLAAFLFHMQRCWAGGDQSHPCNLQAWWNAAFTDFYELKNEEPIQTADHYKVQYCF